jgi:hypothetical protein
VLWLESLRVLVAHLADVFVRAHHPCLGLGGRGA